MNQILNVLFGTPLERAQKNYEKHSKKYQECLSKAAQARTNGNYDYADSKSTEATSHLNMMNHYDKLIEQLVAQAEQTDVSDDDLG